MKNIVGYNSIVKIDPDFHWFNLYFIQSINFDIIRDDFYEKIPILKCVFHGKNKSGISYIVSIKFIDINKCRLPYLGKLVQVSGFDINDVSINGWEGINFEVSDFENDEISLYCKSIVVESIEVIDSIDASID